MAPQAGFEPATLQLTQNAGVWARGFFVPVARMRTCCYLVFRKELCRDCAEWRSADHLKTGFRKMPIEGKCHANPPVGHQDKAHRVDRRQLVQIGPVEILPSALEVAPCRRQDSQLSHG